MRGNLGGSSRVGRFVLALVVVGLAGGAGFWAGRRVLLPPEDPLAAGAEQLTYEVAVGEVGRSLRFTAVAEWQLVPGVRNAAQGIVTSVEFSSGDEATAGTVLYSVDLRPVVVAEGEVPAFRDLSLGVRGPDVAQLQRLLAEHGFLSSEVDGVFGVGTRTAVRDWQASLGAPVDGVVRMGDVIFVPELPARFALAESLRVGVPLSGGEELVLAMPSHPTFTVPLSLEQRSLVPLSARAEVSYPDGVWEGHIERALEDRESSRLTLELTSQSGGPICGNECAEWVQVGRTTNFTVEIVVIPPTDGPVVPVAAIRVDAGNQPYVMTEAGDRLDIRILVSAQGLAVVEGIDAGTVVALPSTPTPAER